MIVKRVESDLLESNTYIIEKDDQCIIIDAGVSTEKLLNHLDTKNVVGILLTHGHYDHVYYVEDYFQKFKCPVYISSEGLKTATDKNLNYADINFIKNPEIFSVFDVDCELNIDEFTVNVIMTPGHSSGSVCYLIEGDLFSGDTLFKFGIGRCDLKGGDEKKMLESLKKLEKINFDKLYSGHGEISNKQEQKRNIAVFEKFLERKI